MLAFTANVDELTCQSKCDVLTCPCFDILGDNESAVAGSLPLPVVPRAAAIAPLGNFMATGAGSSGAIWTLGLLGSVTTVPAGFSHTTALVAGRGARTGRGGFQRPALWN